MRKSLYVIQFSSLILFLSCTNVKNDEISLFNKLNFKILSGEYECEINSSTQDTYRRFFDNNKIQIPFFKHIKHSNYDIFIGIPYNTSLKQIIQDRIQNLDTLSTKFKSDSVSFFKAFRKDIYFISEYSIIVSNKTLIYVSTLSLSKEVSDSLFNYLSLSKRIIQQ